MICKKKKIKIDFLLLKIFSRHSSSLHHRSSSRQSISRGSVPVDKLLFLRHRAKENMKLGRYFIK
jgi:hypothetical protein